MNKILRQFEEKFKCINSNCDSNGTIATLDEQGDCIPEQCQYCNEYLLPIKTFIEKALLEVKEETRKEILEKIDKVKKLYIPMDKELEEYKNLPIEKSVTATYDIGKKFGACDALNDLKTLIK